MKQYNAHNRLQVLATSIIEKAMTRQGISSKDLADTIGWDHKCLITFLGGGWGEVTLGDLAIIGVALDVHFTLDFFSGLNA